MGATQCTSVYLSRIIFACLCCPTLVQAADGHFPEHGGYDLDVAAANETDKEPPRPDKAQMRELGADEDPLGADRIERNIERSIEMARRDSSAGDRSRAMLDLYGSVRVRYRKHLDESGWQDGSSRIGIEAEKGIGEEAFLFGRYEVGFNVLSDLNVLINPGETRGGNKNKNVFTRLLYAGLDSEGGSIVAGKNWSSYYEVASFTDRFVGLGGNASGAYNAQTDGGPTGPGRADRALQSKLSLDILTPEKYEPIDLSLQLQYGNSIPFGNGADYDVALGISAIVTTKENLSVGIGHNYAAVDRNLAPSLSDKGISGDARATIAGVRAFGKRWYTGMVIARMKNHDTTDEGRYFDGWGSELYAQYKLSDRVWVVGGFNLLRPDSNQPHAKAYRIRYGVAGLRYTFNDFRRMLFANIRIDDSQNADGTRVGNVYSVGVRWDFDTGMMGFR